MPTERAPSVNEHHASTGAYRSQSTPRIGLSDVTNVGTSTRRSLFTHKADLKDASQDKPTVNMLETREASVPPAKEEAEEEYPPVERFHREDPINARERFHVQFAESMRDFPPPVCVEVEPPTIA